MQRIHRLAVLAGTLLVAFAVVGPLSAGPAFNNKYAPDEVTVECRDSNDEKVGEIVYAGPLKMWPPNHKYQPVTITATASDPDDNVTLNTRGTHDEFTDEGEELNGSGNTADDVSPASATDSGTGSASTGHDLRSERSGRGDGRVYTLDWEATFVDGDGNEAVCASRGYDGQEDAFEVEVPHDMRCGADWKGGNKGKGGNGQCARA